MQDRIVVAHEGQFRAVSEGGGTPTNITIKDTSSWAHLFPLALDDGKTVLYTEWHGSITNSSLNALSLQSGEVTRLGINGSTPLGILDGRLVYLDPGGNLATVNFDAGWRPSGEPTLVIPDVRSTSGQIQAAISRAGDLIYVGGRVQAQLVVADGDSVRTLVARPNAPLQFPRWSPDGRMIAVMSRLSGASEIWIYSLDARTFTQLTQLRSDDGVLFPEWTPDGKHVLYNVDRTLWSQAVGGGPPAKLVNLVDMRGFGVSPDGQTIVYRTGLEANRKLWYRSLAGDTTSHLLDTGPGAAEPRFSPDGKWIAWTGSDAAVYAARFPHLEDRVRISLEGGHDPVWSPDMRRVYYSAGPATVMVAHVSMAPRPVVTLREKVLEGTYVLGRNQPGFDVSRDGRIVLVRQQRDNGHTIVVQGWINELRGGL